MQQSKRWLVFALIFGVSIMSAVGQAVPQDYSALTYSVIPEYGIPLASGADKFEYGLSGQFSLAYKPPLAFPLYASFDMGYLYTPFKLDWASPMHTALVSAGLGVDYNFFGRFAAGMYVKGGYYEGFLKSLSSEIIYGGNPYLDTGLSLSFYFTPAFRINLGSSYKQLFGKPDNLFQSIGISIGASYRVPLTGSFEVTPSGTDIKPSLLKFSSVEINDIFPVFYKYYDDHPLGKAVITNGERGSIDDIKVSFFIKGYMDNPKTYSIEKPLKKGEKLEVNLFALFNDKVLEITEGTKVSSQLSVEYVLNGKHKSKTEISTVTILNRNASIWDDDRRAAAFITARDPLVLKLSKNLVSMLRGEPSSALGKNFILAEAVHEALSLYGMSYSVDPKTPYKDFHAKKHAVDFLQFPRQTLEYKAGDCDDLSILYASLLEAVSIDTALITVPGHIYIAVDLGMTPRQARSTFYNMDDLIIRDDTVWLPLEVTMTGSDFLPAWQEVAKEWRKYEPLKKAAFLPVSEAWKVYEPVGLPGEASITNFPVENKIRAAVKADTKKAVKREIVNKVKDLEDRITKSGGNPKLINSLGVLYARFGLYENAENEFAKIPSGSRYGYIALVNRGNIRYNTGDFREALDYYKKAQQGIPDNSKLMLNIARVEYELGRFESAQTLFGRIKIISPELAERYAYLGTGNSSDARASGAAEKGAVLWEE